MWCLPLAIRHAACRCLGSASRRSKCFRSITTFDLFSMEQSFSIILKSGTVSSAFRNLGISAGGLKLMGFGGY